MRLNEFASMQPSDGGEEVFRVQAAAERDRLHIDPAPPARSWALELPATGWRDLTPSEAEARVFEGESLLVHGCPGTGKTTRMRHVVERLRALGRVVDVISKTHVASSRAGGCTADHYVIRHILCGGMPSGLCVDRGVHAARCSHPHSAE